MPDGWRCPECGLILAPTVTEHRCDPPAAGGSVATITPFAPIGSGGISTASWPAGTTITVTNSGDAVLSSAQITELTQAVQRRLLQQAKRNPQPRRLA